MRKTKSARENYWASVIYAILLAATFFTVAGSDWVRGSAQSLKLKGTFWSEARLSEDWKLTFPSDTQATLSRRECELSVGCEEWKSLTGTFTLKGNHISIEFRTFIIEGDFAKGEDNNPVLRAKMKEKSGDGKGSFTFSKREEDWDPE